MQLGPAVIVDTSFIQRKYLVPPNIVEGGVLGFEAMTLLTGQEGIGKSLLVMQLAYHIAAGTPWLGNHINEPHRVLLVQKELPDADLQGRYITQLAGRPPTGNLFVVETPFSVQFMGGALYPGYLNDWIREHKPRVIIIDPLVEFHTADENKATEMAIAVLRVVQNWKAQGISTILVHHHGKPDAESPRFGTSRVRGSSAMAGSADTNLQLIEVNRDKSLYMLEFAKLRRCAPRLPLNIWRDKNLNYYLKGQTNGA